jgi:hypothetical protein
MGVSYFLSILVYILQPLRDATLQRHVWFFFLRLFLSIFSVSTGHVWYICHTII